MNLWTIQNVFYAVLAPLLIAEQTSTTRPLLVARFGVPAIEMQSQVGEVHSRWHPTAEPKKVLARSAGDPAPLGLRHEMHTSASEANSDQRRRAPPLTELRAQDILNSTLWVYCVKKHIICYSVYVYTCARPQYMNIEM